MEKKYLSGPPEGKNLLLAKSSLFFIFSLCKKKLTIARAGRPTGALITKYVEKAQIFIRRRDFKNLPVKNNNDVLLVSCSPDVKKNFWRQ